MYTFNESPCSVRGQLKFELVVGQIAYAPGHEVLAAPGRLERLLVPGQRHVITEKRHRTIPQTVHVADHLALQTTQIVAAFTVNVLTRRARREGHDQQGFFVHFFKDFR